MKNIKSRQRFISDHLSHEYTSASSELNGENEESALSPQEVAAKIWDQWMRCRVLIAQVNSCVEFKVNSPD